jgi:UDP-2,3-diacylglucosamine pyrophosphatase LpxH
MHDRLLELLLHVADVRLVARLRDERLGFPFANDLRVMVPDLHLISDKRRIAGEYTYATNYTALIARLFAELRRLKTGLADHETMATYVLGDFLDLWREAPKFKANKDPAAAIRASHSQLIDAVLHPALKTRFLLGNHDFDLYRWAAYRAWDRRYYLPLLPQTAPSIMLVHGDVFSWIERFPDQVQQLLVYFFAPLHSPNDHQLGQIARMAKKEHHNRKYREAIQCTAPAPLGVVRSADSAVLPAEVNVHRNGVASPVMLRFLEPARREASRRSLEFGLELRTLFMGHTHHARIAVHESGDDFFALVDCGSWIETCSFTDEAGTLFPGVPCAQLAALSDNEVRLYQLAPRTG